MLGLAVTLSDLQSEGQWDFVASHFKPDDLILLGDYQPTGQVFRDAKRQIPSHYDTVFMSPPNAMRVPGRIPLSMFKHPENVCYIFGSDSQHTEIMVADRYVYIDVVGHKEMYSWVAGAITLWDRLNGKSNN